MGTAACAYDPSARGGDRKILGVHWLVSLDEAVSFWSSKCLSQGNRQSSIEEVSHVLLQPLHEHVRVSVVYSYACTIHPPQHTHIRDYMRYGWLNG